MPALLIAGLALVLVAAAIAPALAAQAPELGPAAPGDAPPDPAGGSASLDPAPAVSLVGQGAALLEQFGVTVRAIWTPPATAAPYLDAIAQAEADNGLPAGLLARTLFEESRYRPEIIDGTVKSKAGALGIAQFMPATARAAGIDPLDPRQAIPAAARELRAMFNKFGTWTEALAAYNWGQGNLGRKGIGAEPAETRRYVAAIAGDVGLLD